MATTVTMPQMGFDMTEGSIHNWLKQEGDKIEKGEIIAEIDTDKATVELEAFQGGVLKRIVIQPGELVPVGQVVAVIAAPDEQVDWAALGLEGDGGGANAATQAATTDTAADQGAARKGAGEGGEALSANQSISLSEVQNAASVPERTQDGKASTDGSQDGTPAAGPGTHTFYSAAEAVMPPASVQPPPLQLAPANIINAGVSTVPRTVENSGQPDNWVKSSPYARTVATQLGVNIAQVQPSGPNGRILAPDVQQYAASRQPTAISSTRPADSQQLSAVSQTQPVAVSPAAAPQAPQAAGEYEERDLSRMRQTIARRMTEAKQTVPHFYVSSEVEMGEAMKWRQQLNVAVEKEGGTKISVNDMVIKAVAKALHKYPSLNSSFAGSKVRINQHVNIAMAVALDEGLITPVVMDADKKSLGTIAADARQLIEKARAGTLRPEQFQGGTFTVSNLGMYDVDSFVAIINPPQAAILAVGSVKPTVVVKNNSADSPEFGVVQLMKVTISADHRVTDGAVAAQFLQELKRILQNPLSLLI